MRGFSSLSGFLVSGCVFPSVPALPPCHQTTFTATTTTTTTTTGRWAQNGPPFTHDFPWWHPVRITWDSVQGLSYTSPYINAAFPSHVRSTCQPPNLVSSWEERKR